MARVRKAVVAHRRHNKVLKLAKGYYGARSRTFKAAKQAVIKAEQYAYRDRRVRKRVMRSLWIMRINAAAREHGLSYSQFINGLSKSSVSLDRKMIAELAVNNKSDFAELAAKAKASL